MSYQKRRRNRRKQNKQRQQKAVSVQPARTCLFITPSNSIGMKNAQYIGRRTKAEFPKYELAQVPFANQTQRVGYLYSLPHVIVIVCRLGEMSEVTKVYEEITAVKTENPHYLPDVRVWEIKSSPDEIPPLLPEIKPDFKYCDAVIADFLLNRSQRVLLN